MIVCAGFLLAASPVLASRIPDTQINGLEDPSGVAFDGSGNVWITDVENGEPPFSAGVYKYSPYPSQTRLAAPDASAAYGARGFQVAVDADTGEAFVANYNGRYVLIFESDGTYTHKWTSIDGASQNYEGFHVAIDNSNTSARGRVYLSLTAPEDDIEVFDRNYLPVDFPATASYIEANKLTGTPSGNFGSVGNIATDSAGDFYVSDNGKGVVDEFDASGTFLRTFATGGSIAADPTNGNVVIGNKEFDASGNFLGSIPSLGEAFAINSEGRLYGWVEGGTSDVLIFSPAAVVPTISYEAATSPTATAGTLNAKVDPNGGGNVTACKFEYGTEAGNYNQTKACESASSLPFSAPTQVHAAISGLSTEQTYHYRFVVENANGRKYGADQTYTPHHVIGLETEAASNVSASGATLNGSLLGNGSDTHYYFEWGPTGSYGNISPALPGTDLPSPSGPNATGLSVNLTGLNFYSTYHYRVVATEGANTSLGEDETFTTTPGTPSVLSQSATEVHSDRALLHAQINANGGDTDYRFEYVTDAQFNVSGWSEAEKSPVEEIGRGKRVIGGQALVSGLKPGTLYHYRAQATNVTGSGVAAQESTFVTFPFTAEVNDPCPNVHARQQTGAALLLDCRAYELVSAANSGGYDVESTLVPGQEPFGDYPEAEGPSKVLYGVHDGAIPGAGHPTNRGVDPYVATRGENGWSTSYVGIPADNPNAAAPFASTLAEADADLNTFAFGGPEICSPCFEDHSRGIPVHLPGGELAQGMAGSDPQPAAEPAGFVGKHLSADGSHLIFGSTAKFEPDGNSGEVSIYDRNLKTGLTHVVSKTTTGTNLPCLLNCATDGIGELDVSGDGSHVLLGQLVSEAGPDRYWHLYMNVGDSAQTIDLTPGATHGVLYDGMTADGSKVFFTSSDKLTGDDEDSSADLYEAEVSGSSATVTRISTGPAGVGAPGNSDSCDPAANTAHEHWNTTGSEETCGVVAVGGGGGVASGDGTVYFLSPEQLDGSSGVLNAPNLYVVRPGQAPHFVRTLESGANSPLPEPAHQFLRSFGHFTNPTGVAFDAAGDSYQLDVTHDIGISEVYKYDSSGHLLTNFGSHGVLIGGGGRGEFNLPTEIAVDKDPGSPSFGDLYVPDFLNGLVAKFNSSGQFLTQVGIETPSGVAIDQANGDVYVTDLSEEQVDVYDANGNLLKTFTVLHRPSSIAVDSNGTAYVTSVAGPVIAYDSSGNEISVVDTSPSYGVAVDPSDNHLYVDEGNQISEFDPSGNQVGSPFGSGTLTDSIGLAAHDGEIYASNNPGVGSIAVFGAPAVVDPEADNPLVIDSVGSPGVRHTADFQITPSGNDAAFTSVLPLTGYDTAAHREIYRYDAPSEELACVSCSPTTEQATADASLPIQGLALSADGRVFFNSTEGLVDRDLNGREDAYEWEPQGSGPAPVTCQTAGGCVDLISTGISPLNASLFGVSSDGTDAYFFTSDKLAQQDENGNTVKLYDARSFGGFSFLPAPVQCKASDECHGASSPAPPAPNIQTVAPTPHIASSTGCKAGFVKKHGKCVRKSQKSKHHKKKGRRHGRVAKSPGGGK
jgi:hypothetical protein